MRYKTLIALALAAAALPGASPHAQERASEAADAEVAARARAILDAAFPADGPGASAMVVRGGETLFLGARGVADVRTGEPLAPDGVMPLGSIAKQFTAAVALQLVAEGKLSLDDPLSRFFPDWPEPGAKATVRQLLNHTSGLFDYSKVPGWIGRNRDKTFATADLIAVMRGLEAKSAPGTAWEYNNGGYVMLGAIVEQVTGMAWHEAIEQRLARPLGLASLTYAGSPEVRGQVATGHSLRDGGQQPVALPDLSVAGAAGGLVGSLPDLARWAAALHGGRVVSPALYREMTSPAVLADGSSEPYGFGLRLRELRGSRAFVHGGALAGYRSESAYLPETDVYVALFANTDDPSTDLEPIMIRLAALAMGEPLPEFAPLPLDRAAVEPLFGLYEREGDPPVTFFERGGKLYLDSGEREMELLPASGDRFYRAPEGLSWIAFSRAADGTPLMALHDPTAKDPQTARRAGEVPAPLAVPPEVLASYHGTFQTETIELTVGPGENGWLTLTAQGDAMPLRPVSQTEFVVEGTPMKIVFHRENGTVDKLTLHRGARELHGTRKSQ